MKNWSNYVISVADCDDFMPSRGPQSLVLIPVQIPKIHVPILIIYTIFGLFDRIFDCLWLNWLLYIDSNIKLEFLRFFAIFSSPIACPNDPQTIFKKLFGAWEKASWHYHKGEWPKKDVVTCCDVVWHRWHSHRALGTKRVTLCRNKQ